MQRRLKIYAKFGGRCAYCGEQIAFYEMQIDHIQPRAKGGRNRLDNLNPACEICNTGKADSDLEDFRLAIVTQADRLRRYSSHFRLAERYNIVEATDPILPEFYFESQAAGAR